MEKSYQVLKQVLEKAGIKKVAADLHLSTAMVYKWCEKQPQKEKLKNPSGARNPLDRIEQIYRTTHDARVIQWICQMGGGFFVENPGVEKPMLDESVLQNAQRLLHEFSEALQSITAAYQDDRKISPQEAENIRKEWEDVKRVGECFVTACESGVFNK